MNLLYLFVYFSRRFQHPLIIIFLIFPNLSDSEEVKLQRAVPYAILNRVFQIQIGDNSGTCFVIDINQRQYIITAKHLVPKKNPPDTVKISINDNWHSLKIRLIFPENEATDIVALAADKIIASKMKISVGASGIFAGQDVYFLGFPFHLSSKTEGVFPINIAFVKKGILSAIVHKEETVTILYIDGHNNPGFSGGPVIYANYNKKERLQIAGVISGYKFQPIEVHEVEVKGKDSKTGQEEKKLIRYVKENTGIIISHDIGSILEQINKNPIGPIIPNEK